MSFSATPERPRDPQQAYTRLRRVKDAVRFIRNCASISASAMEATKAVHVARTYGVEAALVRRIKARFRNELSFGSEGK